jgi:hypothetical protein
MDSLYKFIFTINLSTAENFANNIIRLNISLISAEVGHFGMTINLGVL